MTFVSQETSDVNRNAIADDASKLFSYSSTSAKPATAAPRNGRSVADQWARVRDASAAVPAAPVAATALVTSATTTSGDDVDRAASFLREIARGGLISLAAIVPDGALSGVTFDTSTECDKIVAWIREMNGHANVYFTLNEPKPEGERNGKAGKLRESDVARIRGIAVDLDPAAPADDTTEQQKRELLASERQRLAAVAAQWSSDSVSAPASVAIDSGGGLQLVWLFPEPLPATRENVAAVKAQARGMGQMLGGDAVQSVDHLFRVPFTTNLPNATKRRNGRTQATSRLLHFNQDATSTLERLRTVAAPLDVTQKATVELASVDYNEILVAAKGDTLPPHLETAVEEMRLMRGFSKALGNTDRSARDYALACLCVEYGLTDPVEIGQVTFSLSPEKLVEKDGNGYGAKYAANTIKNALARTKRRPQYDGWFDGIPATDGSAPSPTPERPSWKERLALRPVTDDEWATSKATRPCIVDNWVYEDVGHLAAPGGVGKTTLLLFQAIHVVLGRDLFGYSIKRSGPVVYLTGEDERQTLLARLRHMCAELGLTAEETKQVRENVHILDVAGEGFKLTKVANDTIVPSDELADLIEAVSAAKPALLIIDPTVSFGVGESRVNDAEQGLIEAGRRIVRKVGCGVQFVHHTGKQNARDKTLDQYSGRGGSALADGSRMTHVMQSLTAEEWAEATGDVLHEGESGVVYARPKITWGLPNQPDIYIKRKGYTFKRFAAAEKASGTAEEIKLHVAYAANLMLGAEGTADFGVIWERLGQVLRDRHITQAKTSRALRTLVSGALGGGGVEIDHEGQRVRIEAIQTKPGSTAPWTIKRTAVKG